MSRAQALAAATDYLFQAVFALDGAARVLDGAGVLGAADQARGLHDRGVILHAEIGRATEVAHRAERPELYDADGSGVGRQPEGGEQ